MTSAVLVGLPAYFLTWFDGALAISGTLVVAGTIVTGLVLVTQKKTRRLGLGLLLGSVVTWFIAAAASFVLLLHIASTVGA